MESTGLKLSMAPHTARMVTEEDTRLGKDWEIICRRVSVSLV